MHQGQGVLIDTIDLTTGCIEGVISCFSICSHLISNDKEKRQYDQNWVNMNISFQFPIEYKLSLKYSRDFSVSYDKDT